jgi:membrane protease YdiL (CAAX protease family)
MRSRVLFVVEVAVIATVFYLDWIGILPVSKTPYLFLLGWISLRVRCLRWKDVGLNLGPRPDWPLTKILFVGVIVGIGMEALELFATQPLLTNLLNKGPDLHEYQRLVGNAQLLILGIVLAWVLAAFGEETVWRGYLMNRFAEIFGSIRHRTDSPWRTSAWIASAILVSLLFGVAHFSQGPTGISENVIDGAILAGVYFATGRNLWAPIIAHGIQDTIDVLLIYLGAYPGLSQSTLAGS